jgi:hypothetical protein
LRAVGAVVEKAGGKDRANAREELLVWLLGQALAVQSCGCAYGDVVFCKLVVKVVYTDLASVTRDKSAIICF